MGEKYRLNDSGGNAIVSLLIRVLKMVFIETILALVVFFLMHNFTGHLFLIVEGVIVVQSLIYYMLKREATEVIFEADKLVVKGRRFICLSFTYTADYAKVRYKFKKTTDRKSKQGLTIKNPSLVLYKHKGKWVEFTPSMSGWSRGTLAEIVKVLIARGCYNWFDFHKRR